jgi:hypothetical protein
MMIEPRHADNLAMLASHLEALPSNYLHFDMETYFHSPAQETLMERDELKVADRVAEMGCGTVACALGHGPAAGVPVPRGTECWDQYANDVFGVEGVSFSYLFDGGWANIEPTAAQAAARIRQYLADGVPPRFSGALSLGMQC